MRHYLIYDETTGEILLHIKTSGPPPNEKNYVEASKKDCEGSAPVESIMQVNLRTKKLERK